MFYILYISDHNRFSEWSLKLSADFVQIVIIVVIMYLSPVFSYSAVVSSWSLERNAISLRKYLRLFYRYSQTFLEIIYYILPTILLNI